MLNKVNYNRNSPTLFVRPERRRGAPKSKGDAIDGSSFGFAPFQGPMLRMNGVDLLCLSILFLLPSVCHGQILDQLGKSKDESPIIIDAQKSVVCDETAQKCVATGAASAQKGTSTVYGDVLTVHFKEGEKKREITTITADGHVRMTTPTETAYGEHAHYDAALDRIILTGGNLKIVTPNEILTARDSIEYYHGENKGVARGNAIAQFPQKKQLIQADTLVAYFKSAGEKPDQQKAEEDQNNMALERVEAEGNILASGPNGIVTGDRGVYQDKTKIVEVFHNVKITQDKNVIEGEYAKFNLDTNVAEMYTQPPQTAQDKPFKRVSGIIIPKSTKKVRE